jgi:phage portal protein BeeE
VSVEVTKTGRVTYKVSTASGQTRVGEGGMLHIVGPMSEDGYTGRSVISTCRETLGLGLALERYGSEFFSNAATPRGVLTTQGILSTGHSFSRHLASILGSRRRAPRHPFRCSLASSRLVEELVCRRRGADPSHH